MTENQQVEHTPDGHHVLIGGRRWRATDPEVPEGVRDRLTHHLMAARRALARLTDDPDAERAARARVRLAKTGLGERGTPWWEQTLPERRRRWEHSLRALDDADRPPRPADG
ncbi:hypothetical protein HUT16_33285 [Kitasatospora sp. NA04385]|uniref:hypothetical protein n=1 Tax=Kitasatospora sp. NA04385 TaxID=2742135 RepID=UPI00158FF3ED|nr:hypothetical protein [Kitasatospora sp. NA04385]QKW23315.1 hypothetical protein HUT16_33285 [Kitasatospora sp. NA04385]